MRNILFLAFFFCFSFCLAYSQTKIEEDVEIAYQNAKKGIYWALDNIPEKKVKLENDLIADDKLYARVKLDKEIFGIKIESTGYNNSNEVTITLYKSDESLVKEGYLKK